jgi:hypothetical protein
MEKVLKEIKDLREIIDEKITTPNARLRNLKNAKKQRAKIDIEDLIKKLNILVAQYSVFILATGKQHDKFAELANEFGCFSVSGDELYDKVVESIPKHALQTGSMGPIITEQINIELERMSTDMGVLALPTVFYKTKYKGNIKKEGALKEKVAQAINDQVGSELIGYYAISKVKNQIIENNETINVVPIVIHTEDEKLILDFMKDFGRITQKIFLVTTGAKNFDEKTKELEIDSLRSVKRDNVEKTLGKIKELL